MRCEQRDRATDVCDALGRNRYADLGVIESVTSGPDIATLHIVA